LIEFTTEALQRLIRDYTREAGVRNMEREIGAICRKVARRVAGGETKKTVVTPDDLKGYLGAGGFTTALPKSPTR
jgi:ATP-dependent Lon protease